MRKHHTYETFPRAITHCSKQASDLLSGLKGDQPGDRDQVR